MTLVLALVAASEAAPLFEVKKLSASDAAAGDRFGRSVVIDGNTAFAGADGEDDAGPRAGAAYVFDAKAPTPTPTIPPVGGIAFEPELGAVVVDTTAASGASGIAELPDADAAPLASSDSSGMSRGLVAAVVAGLAAVVALGGAGWYARRRFTN